MASKHILSRITEVTMLIQPHFPVSNLFLISALVSSILKNLLKQSGRNKIYIADTSYLKQWKYKGFVFKIFNEQDQILSPVIFSYLFLS